MKGKKDCDSLRVKETESRNAELVFLEKNSKEILMVLLLSIPSEVTSNSVIISSHPLMFRQIMFYKFKEEKKMS